MTRWTPLSIYRSLRARFFGPKQPYRTGVTLDLRGPYRWGHNVSWAVNGGYLRLHGWTDPVPCMGDVIIIGTVQPSRFLLVEVRGKRMSERDAIDRKAEFVSRLALLLLACAGLASLFLAVKWATS